MIRLSASLIKDYLDCTQRGYYRIHDPEQSLQSEYMLAGTIVHEMIEHDTVYTYGDLLAKGLSDARIESIDNCYKNYWRIKETLGLNGGLFEHRFDYSYTKGVHIVGKIDRITDDGILIDWKTSSTIKNNIDSDPQFIIYDEAYRRIFNKPPKAVLCIYLTNNKVVQYNKQEQNVHELYERVIPRIIKMIKNNQYSRDGIYNSNCYMCPFKEYCLRCQDGM